MGRRRQHVVREDFRNVGIGSALLVTMINFADGRGYARLVLSPSARALPFFRRNGFIVPDERAGQDRLLVRPFNASAACFSCAVGQTSRDPIANPTLGSARLRHLGDGEYASAHITLRLLVLTESDAEGMRQCPEGPSAAAGPAGVRIAQR